MVSMRSVKARYGSALACTLFAFPWKSAGSNSVAAMSKIEQSWFDRASLPSPSYGRPEIYTKNSIDVVPKESRGTYAEAASDRCKFRRLLPFDRDRYRVNDGNAAMQPLW